MVNREKIEKYKQVQNVARATINHLRNFIQEGCTEADIAHEAEAHLLKNGADGFWYYNIGAIVLVGKRTVLSISGKKYTGPTEASVLAQDMVTVDLSPMTGGVWGDFARTFIIDGGKVVALDSSELEGWNVEKEWIQGIHVEEQLHAILVHKVVSGMTFDKIFRTMNAEIISLGFENLDFRNNLGHTIVRRSDDRTFLEAGCEILVDAAGLFTFEPHIKKKNGGRYGFRKEDIYYMHNGKLVVL